MENRSRGRARPAGAPKVYTGPIDRHAEPERLTHSPNPEIVVDWFN
jgi:hypothetical protein